ncbi:uracil-xanthine permease family protein [Acidocella sp.]|uniref:uracil-xanthine permease family protein n=1 Tax=Acidocella sp. TaxID=50710 RepID=UPI002F41795D
MRKPDTITYGTEDRPPTPVLLMLSTQQVMVLSIFLLAPVLLTRAAHLPLEQATNFISVTTFALGVATLLQIRRWGPVGSGLLITPISASNWLPGCLIAVRAGGLPMVSGFLLVAALVEIVLSRLFRVLRGLLPAELSGLVVLVTGLSVAQTGMNNVVAGVTMGHGVFWLRSLLVSAGTLTVMVGFTVWARGPIGKFGACIGLVGGYMASIALGLVDAAPLHALTQAPLVRLPTVAATFPSFERPLLLPALITGIAITLNSMGAMTAAQKLNDADWHRQDLGGLSRGLLADGLGVVVSALIGGGGVSVSGSSVSLTAAARATSRTIGYAAAAGFLIMSLVPRFSLLMLTIPQPVVGAVLVFLSCSLMVSGVTIMSSRLLDMRKTFTLGIAFAFAVATPALVQAGAILPDWMTPVVASPLLASALVAILLNPVLRLGIRQQVELQIPKGGLPDEDVAKFITRAGAAWGARRDVIERAKGPIAECLDTLVDAELANGPGCLTLGFNELQLDARISWHGAPLILSAKPPTKEELVTDDTAAARMAGYLIGHLASRVTSRIVNGMPEVHLRFDH